MDSLQRPMGQWIGWSLVLQEFSPEVSGCKSRKCLGPKRSPQECPRFFIQAAHLFFFECVRFPVVHLLWKSRVQIAAAQEWFQWDHARRRRWRFRWFHGFGGCVSYGPKDLWVRERHGGAQRKGKWNPGNLPKPGRKLPNREDVRKKS